MRNKAIYLLLLLAAVAAVVVGVFVIYTDQRESRISRDDQAALSSTSPWNISSYKTPKSSSFSSANIHLVGGFTKLPFASLGEGIGEVFINEKYESKFVGANIEISFPFPGIPIDLKVIKGKYNFAFRKIFDGDLYRLTYDRLGKLQKQQSIALEGIDFPIFRAATVSDDSLYWVVYDNKRRKNYFFNADRFHGKDGDMVELPTFFPPAGGTYEMEPTVFLGGNEKDGFALIAGALYAKIKDGKVEGKRLPECETAVEVTFSPAGPIVLCRALQGKAGPYFLTYIDENRVEYLSMEQGIPWRLQYQQESKQLKLRRAKSQSEILELFLWDLRNAQQSGALEFGINNIEGRIPWSQIYYLNGLMDTLLLTKVHHGAHSLFSEISGDLSRRISLELRSLDDLLELDKGFHTKGFTHDRSLALFAVQTSRLLLLFDRYAEEFPNATPLRNTEKLRRMVSELDSHIDQLAHEGEDAVWMKSKTSHLRWPKCSAFYFDGMAVPFNHQNEWAYSLFNAARVRGLPADTSSLDSQRDIIGFFMDRLAEKEGFPSTDNWYYWYGHAYDGWKKEDNLSCNMPEYVGDHGLAWISFRTIDFMSVMSALDFMNNLNKDRLMQSGFDAVKHGDVYPFAARSLLVFGTVPQIQIPVLERYYRAIAPWELANTPWALAMSFSGDE